MLTIFIAVSGLKSEDRAESEIEARTLAQMPEIDRNSLLDGSFFTLFENYQMDQFAFRDQVVGLYSRIKGSLGNKKKNDIIIGEDNVMVPYREDVKPDTYEDYTDYGDEQVEACEILKSAAESYGGTLIYVNIPHKKEFAEDAYPWYFYNGSVRNAAERQVILEKMQKAGIETVEMYDILDDHRDEYLYFKTDHHYTMRAAYYTYKQILEKINELQIGADKYDAYPLTYPEWEDMELVVSQKKFIGSYMRKAGDLSDNYGDYFFYALPSDFPTEYTRYENGKKSKKQLIYNNDEKDEISFAAFMSGDNACTSINTSRKNLPSILYVGYSYTNPLELMSVYNFNKTFSLDPRYYEGSLYDFIVEKKPDYVVVIRDDLRKSNEKNICTIGGLN